MLKKKQTLNLMLRDINLTMKKIYSSGISHFLPMS